MRTTGGVNRVFRRLAATSGLALILAATAADADPFVAEPGAFLGQLVTQYFDSYNQATGVAGETSMPIGTKIVTNKVENELKDQADKLVDKGPMDQMEDKADDKKDEVIRKTVTKPLR
jgi:hypothetical protein